MPKDSLYTDAEFHAVLATRFKCSPSRVRSYLTKWGKIEPRYITTDKGFGRRKGYTEGNISDAKAYLAVEFAKNPNKTGPK